VDHYICGFWLFFLDTLLLAIQQVPILRGTFDTTSAKIWAGKLLVNLAFSTIRFFILVAEIRFSFDSCTWSLFTEIKVGLVMFKSVFKKHGHFIELFLEHLQRRKSEHSLWKLYKNPLSAIWGYFLLELINSNSIF